MSGPQPGHVQPNQISSAYKSRTGHIRSSSRVPERWAGHVWPPTQTCPGFWHPNGYFWLSKKNWTVRFQKPGYSVFAGLKHPDRNYPFTVFSLLSHTHSRTTMRATLRPPLVISWFLCGILEFLGEINTQESVSLFPQLVFPILRYLHLILNLFALWMDLKFFWCIVFIHVIDQSTAISLSFLG
jgi:hypothetical protein